MPILPREPDLFPEDLLDGSWQAAAGAAWWALYTMPRREKDLARRLLRLQVPFYAPLVSHRTRSPQGRTRCSFVPLFPGYVFMAATEEQRQVSFTTNCISRCLAVADGPQLIHDLRQVRQLVLSEAPLTPEAKLAPGMRVRVRSGPFAGLEGTVFKRRGAERLLIMVQFLQQGASVELEDFQVERIDK